MTIIDPYAHPFECICVVCGGHRCACSYPPVCDDPGCLMEWQIEVEFHRWVRGDVESIDKINDGF